jgi:hypothetical protein
MRAAYLSAGIATRTGVASKLNLGCVDGSIATYQGYYHHWAVQCLVDNSWRNTTHFDAKLIWSHPAVAATTNLLNQHSIFSGVSDEPIKFIILTRTKRFNNIKCTIYKIP